MIKRNNYSLKKICLKAISFATVFFVLVLFCGVKIEVVVIAKTAEKLEGDFVENDETHKREIREQYENLEIKIPKEVFVETYYEQEEINNKSLRTSGVYYYTGNKTNTDKISTALRSGEFEIVEDNMTGIDTSYSFEDSKKSSFAMPGMKNTNVMGVNCDDMIPQGITYYDGYIFLTAYCGEKEHNSVIYVIDRTTLKYVTTLVLEGKPHAGGITYANGYLWIGATSKVHYYKYSSVKSIIEYTENNSSIKSAYIGSTCDFGIMSIPNNGEASFLTTYSNYLCLGSFQEEGEVTGLIQYCEPIAINNGMLTCREKTNLPSYAQGMTFYSCYDITYMMITTSYGILNSEIYIYSTRSKLYDVYTLSHDKTITFPCYLEEAITVNNYTYFVFESCAKAYRTYAPYVSGDVCGMLNTFIYK